jgi:DNA-binding protein YbaB
VSADPRQQLVQRLTALRLPQISQADIDGLAAREFVASDADATVTATVSGAGELLRLEILTSATRGPARETVGGLVVGVVNDALDQADAARRALRPGGGDGVAKLDEITEQFGVRMDALLARLDDISRGLPG